MVTEEELNSYRAGLHARLEMERAALARRRTHAWDAARRAAGILREQFASTRVVVFGSLLKEECFHEASDVDLAAWGIAPVDTFRAIATLMGLDAEVEVNLVDVETCRPGVLAAIERDGIPV